MDPSVREYQINNVITFARTDGRFGALSNMASGFNLFINEVNIQSSEILYQACRFPVFPNIQEEIIRAQNPMDAKKISRQYIQYSRQDWDKVKFKIMKWCLEVKLIQNFDKFSHALLSTDDKTIVEYSKNDAVWGATLKDDKTTLVGKNALGRLLMELREKVKTHEISKSTVILSLNIPAFLLFGNPIEEVRNDAYFINDLDEIYA
ncbi:MAG: NADAR family protein [Bacteroidetes bacterium]|nr:NADAR family protein [Bacteroidota bacterium]